MYYTAIKQTGILEHREIVENKSHRLAILHFSSIFSQCNTRLRLRHLLYDIEVMFSMFYTLKSYLSYQHTDMQRLPQ